MDKLQLDHQILLCLRILAPKQVGGRERLRGWNGKEPGFGARWLCDGLLQYQLTSSSQNSMHLACQYRDKHSLQNCLCFLWIVQELMCVTGHYFLQPCLLLFSFSWVPLLSWHPYFPFLPFHCGWRLCLPLLGPLLFLFTLHTPAPFLCQFTCLLAFLACAHHPCPISMKGFTQSPLSCFLSSPEALLSASFCLCARFSLFFCVSVPRFLGWLNLCSRVSHSWDLQAQIDVVVGEVTGGRPAQLKNSVAEALKRETV